MPNNYFLVVFAHAPVEILQQRFSARTHDQIIDKDELGIVQKKIEYEIKLCRDTFCLDTNKIIFYDSSTQESLHDTVTCILKILRAQ